MNIRSSVRTLVVTLALASAASAASAQSLPVFPVTTPAGAAASSAELPAAGNWLLVYLSPSAGPSDRLLQWLGETWSDQRAARIVFIVAGAPADVKTYLAAKGGEALAANAKWFADPEGAAWTALKFQGPVAVAGVASQTIDWKLDGVLADDTVLQPAITAWLQ